VARALFLSLPLHGHVNPSLPLVRGLVGRGDSVTYVGTAAFRPAIEATGATFWPYQNPYLASMSELPLQPEAIAWLLIRTTGEVLEHELDDFHALAPDYIVADSVAPWGAWIGALLEVPVIGSVSTFAFNRAVLAWAGAAGVRPKGSRRVFSKIRNVARALLLLRRLRRRYGVRGPGLMASMMGGRAELNLVYTSREFQPRADTFQRDRYHFIGPSIGARTEIDDVPWPSLTKPIVFVSLGTLFNRDVGFYRRCIEALTSEGVDVILSVGRHVPLDSVGPVPAGVIVRQVVAQLEVLRRATVFVTHGGMNSVSESLSAGVPMVVVPQMGEQEIVARRVQDVGAGLFLAPADATAEALREAVDRVRTDKRFREAAVTVGGSFRACGGVADGLRAISCYLERPHVDPGPGRSS